MKTKLILVEGIPGSGKSTFARRIADFYTQLGQSAELLQEGGYHPADLAWNAWIPLEQLENALAPYGEFRGEIEKNLHLEDGFAVLSYTQVKNGSKAFYQDMESHEVYDSRVPPGVFDALHLKRWAAFCRQAKQRDALTVFECAFLQNHISELLLFRLADLDAMKRHCHALLETVAELSPVLVYLYQPNLKETIERVAKQRVFENGSWIDGLIPYIENTPYGKLHQLRGLDGVVRSLEARQSAEREIIRSLPIETIVLKNSRYDWEALWDELAGKLPHGMIASRRAPISSSVSQYSTDGPKKEEQPSR